MAVDYYQLLGVSRSANADEIKKAFRTKAHQLHPDKAGGDAEKFKEINEAYQVLGDSQKRQQYDQFGQTHDQARRQGGGPAGAGGFGGFGQAGGFNGNVDFGDLGDIFGDMFGFGGGRRASRATRGNDIQAAVRLDFRTAAFGGEQKFELRHHIACSKCQGSGTEPGHQPVTCATCGGRGQVQRAHQTILGTMQSMEACATCRGLGTTIDKPCTRCHGQGRTQEVDAISVKIPAGIADGQRIKLGGRGEAGPRGTPPGDLYLEVSIASDATLKREDDDVLTTDTIPLTVAALGGTVDVATIDGSVKLKIPAGTPSGKVFLIKGKGITHLRGRGRGDHRVTVEVDIPKHLSIKAKKLLKELQDEGV